MFGLHILQKTLVFGCGILIDLQKAFDTADHNIYYLTKNSICTGQTGSNMFLQMAINLILSIDYVNSLRHQIIWF